MGIALEARTVKTSTRARWVLPAVLLGLLVVVGFGVWRAAQPPSFDEQYQSLMGVSPIGSSEFTFDRMSSPQSFSEATEVGRANIYGYFDGPGERNVIVYQLFKSPGAAERVFRELRENAQEGPSGQWVFTELRGMWSQDDYKLTTPGYSRYTSNRENVIIQGEAWRSNEDEVDDRTLDERAFAMMRVAMKTYSGLFGD